MVSLLPPPSPPPPPSSPLCKGVEKSIWTCGTRNIPRAFEKSQVHNTRPTRQYSYYSYMPENLFRARRTGIHRSCTHYIQQLPIGYKNSCVFGTSAGAISVSECILLTCMAYNRGACDTIADSKNARARTFIPV